MALPPSTQGHYYTITFVNKGMQHINYYKNIVGAACAAKLQGVTCYTLQHRYNGTLQGSIAQLTATRSTKKGYSNSATSATKGVF